MLLGLNLLVKIIVYDVGRLLVISKHEKLVFFDVNQGHFLEGSLLDLLIVESIVHSQSCKHSLSCSQYLVLLVGEILQDKVIYVAGLIRIIRTETT
jgi:hypothetical protein